MSKNRYSCWLTMCSWADNRCWLCLHFKGCSSTVGKNWLIHWPRFNCDSPVIHRKRVSISLKKTTVCLLLPCQPDTNMTLQIFIASVDILCCPQNPSSIYEVRAISCTCTNKYWIWDHFRHATSYFVLWIFLNSTNPNWAIVSLKPFEIIFEMILVDCKLY